MTRNATRNAAAAPALAAAGAVALALATAAAVAGDRPIADLRLVTDDDALAGRQAQSPVWAPGDVPRLVHEVTDRDKQTLLRVVVPGDELHTYVVPGSRTSRLERLGGGANRSDRGASWWDSAGFFFVRSAGEGATLHFFDGVPRAVPGAPALVTEVLADPARDRLFVVADRDGEVDVVRYPGTDLSVPGTTLTSGAGTVEHSLDLGPGGEPVFVVTTRESTRVATTAGDRSLGVPDHELLSVAAVPGAPSALAFARTCDAHDCAHVLLEQPLDSGAAKVLAERVLVPAGQAPRPAVTPDGRHVFFVADDPANGNPVVRLDRTTGATVAVTTGTTGNQEVAVAVYEEVVWLAVVAVGDAAGTDVRNHLYVGPIRD